MEENSRKESLLLRIFQKIASSRLSIKEYVFAIVVTLVQIGIPFIYELIRGNNAREWQVLITGGILIILFQSVWKIEEFIEINFVEFIYFQIVVIVGVLLLALPVVFCFREEVKVLYGFQIPFFDGRLEGVVIGLLVVFVVVCSFFFYDVLVGVLLWLYVRYFHAEFKNPYFEKIKAARDIEDFKEYERRKLKEAYEKMAEETVYKPKPLFEHTKFFKQITDLEQVKPRYHAMMKIYHPDNQGGSIEMTLELQKEYQEIVNKYNL